MPSRGQIGMRDPDTDVGPATLALFPDLPPPPNLASCRAIHCAHRERERVERSGLPGMRLASDSPRARDRNASINGGPTMIRFVTAVIGVLVVGAMIVAVPTPLLAKNGAVKTEVRADLVPCCGDPEPGAKGKARRMTITKNGGGAQLDFFSAQVQLPIPSAGLGITDPTTADVRLVLSRPGRRNGDARDRGSSAPGRRRPRSEAHRRRPRPRLDTRVAVFPNLFGRDEPTVVLGCARQKDGAHDSGRPGTRLPATYTKTG